MTDDPRADVREAYLHPTNGSADNGAAQTQAQRDVALKRALVFIGVAAASAGFAYWLVRATLKKPSADPTTERIQALTKEIDRLLKQLDENSG